MTGSVDGVKATAAASSEKQRQVRQPRSQLQRSVKTMSRDVLPGKNQGFAPPNNLNAPKQAAVPAQVCQMQFSLLIGTRVFGSSECTETVNFET